MGNDTLRGSDSNDIFVPGAGNDKVIGGAGTDLLQFYDSEGMTHGAVVDLERGLVEDDGSGGTDQLSGIEDVAMSSRFDDVVYGDENDNRLTSHGGADLLVGRGGNDRLVGGENATLLGGSGNDELNGNYSPNYLDGGEGADTLHLWGYFKSDLPDTVASDADDTVIDHRENQAGRPQPVSPEKQKEKRRKKGTPQKTKAKHKAQKRSAHRLLSRVRD